MAVRSIDLTGRKFGRLSVVSRAPKGDRKNRGAIWVCKCDCGELTQVRADSLKNGRTKSCGCLSSETAVKVHTKHGCASGGGVTREYQAWVNMRARCSGIQKHCWKNYGGRGISVCQEWDASFEAFFSHVGESPGPGYELDRIDNDLGYQPGNVRWVTKSENNKNRRSKSRVMEDDHVS